MRALNTFLRSVAAMVFGGCVARAALNPNPVVQTLGLVLLSLMVLAGIVAAYFGIRLQRARRKVIR